MELNDDDIIVIVVDENSTNETGIKVDKFDIKEEPHDYVEDQYTALIQHALNYVPEIKREKEDPVELVGYLEDDIEQSAFEEVYLDVQEIKIENEEQVEYEQSTTIDGEDKYRPCSVNLSHERDLRRATKMPIHTPIRNSRRRTAPALWKSKVAELCNNNPMLRMDKDALVQEIVNLMLSVKPPMLDFVHHTLVEDRVYRCDTCETVSTTRGACERHYMEYHGPRYLICYSCGDDFRSAASLHRHEKRCTAPDAPLVLRARAAFIKRKSHGGRDQGLPELKNDKTIKGFHCSLCPAVLKELKSLLAHERLHRGEKPFQCHLCTSAYSSECALTKHMWLHKPDSFVCHHCGRGFKCKSYLVSHMLSHTVARFCCKECPRIFKYKEALQAHTNRKHLNLPKPFVCPMCPKRYSRMKNSKYHMMKAHSMQLMTSQTFFKKLPVMSDNEITQAKVVHILKDPIQPSKNKVQVKPL